MNKKVAINYVYNTIYHLLILLAPIVTTPYVSRVLGVTNIGIYNFAKSIVTYFVLIGVVGTSLYGQREIAYLQDDAEKRTKTFWEIELFRLTTVLLCLIAFGVSFCISGEYVIIYRILSIEIIAAGVDISWLYMGMENFKITAVRSIIVKCTGIVLLFIFVKSQSDLPIYALCIVLPTIIANLSLCINAKKYLIRIQWTRSSLWTGIKQRIRPVLILFFPQIARDVYLVLDKTMIGMLSSSIDQVGYYSQAQKIVKLTMTIATSLGAVMLPAMAAYYAKGDHEKIVRSIRTAFRFIFMLSFALMFGICAIAERFTPIFFGKGYDPVSSLMIAISPIIVIIAISNVIGTQYLLPTKQQKAFTISIIAGAFTNMLLNCLLIPKYEAVGASIATVVAETAVTIVQCVYVRKQLPLKQYLLSGVKYALYGTVMLVLTRMLSTVIPKTLWALLLLVCFGGFVYVIQLIIFKDPMIKLGHELVKWKNR